MLATLARATEAISGRALARRVNASQSGVARVLQRLVSDGLVLRQDQPPVALFALNRDHLLAEAIGQIVEAPKRLLDRVGQIAAQWSVSPVNVTVFGSVARGVANRESDVDLLIVRDDSVNADNPKWAEQLTDLEIDVARWTGNPASVIEYSLQALINAPPAFLEALRNDGITVFGLPIRQWVPPKCLDRRGMRSDSKISTVR